MVTAILPSMTNADSHANISSTCNTTHKTPLRHCGDAAQRHSTTPSLTSELTITPERYSQSNSRSQEGPENTGNRDKQDTKTIASPPKLAGLVGVFTGCGAL